MASLSRQSALSVLKRELRKEYRSGKWASFSPIPRSGVRLHVKDIFVEVRLSEKDEAVKVCRESEGREALFLPMDDKNSRPLFASKGE